MAESRVVLLLPEPAVSPMDAETLEAESVMIVWSKKE